MVDHKTVGIVGASGIGKHHASWWNMEGAQVCGFVGTSPDSVAQTRERLQEMFGFQGVAYTDFNELVEEQKPDIIDVCSPPRCHYDHVLGALAAGCDCLCEKPFVFEGDVPADELLDQARTLVTEARSAGVRLGLCSQYHVSARCCSRIMEAKTHGETINRFRGHLAAPAAGRTPEPYKTWVDLAPHMLAALQALFPDGAIDFDSCTFRCSGFTGRAQFVLKCRDDRRVECEIITDRTTEESERSHVRRFQLNDAVFDIEGEHDENGVYHALYETPWGTMERPDPMRSLIREFLAGGNPIDARAALQNLTWLLRIPG